MAIYLKKKSLRPETCSSFRQITSIPEGYMVVTRQHINDLQTAMDANPDGSIVNVVWVVN